MPELPEVETVVRELRPELVGRRIVRVKIGKKSLRKRWTPAWTKRLLGQRVQDGKRTIPRTVIDKNDFVRPALESIQHGT